MKPLLLLLFLSSAFLLSCQPANSQEKASKESLATKAAPGEVISVVLSQDDFRAKMAELGAGIQLVDVRRHGVHARDVDGRIVTSAGGLAAGATLVVQFRDGRATSLVEHVNLEST